MKKTIFMIVCIMVLVLFCDACNAETSVNEKEKIINRKMELEQQLGTLDEMQIYISPSDSFQDEPSDSTSIDEKFLSDFIRSLESRWEISENLPSLLTSEQTKSLYAKCVQAELDILQQYQDVTLNDPWLDLLAHSYLKALQNQDLAINTYCGSNNALYEEYWITKGTNIRMKTLYFISQYYKTPINSKYQQTMQNMTDNGYKLTLADPVDVLITFLDDPVSLLENNEAKGQNDEEKSKNPFEITFVSKDIGTIGYSTISLSLKNNTNDTINTTTLNVCFTDHEGNIISSTHPQEPDRIRPGKSLKFSVLFKTDLNPFAMYVDSISFYNSAGLYKQVYLDNIEEYVLSQEKLEKNPETETANLDQEQKEKAEEQTNSIGEDDEYTIGMQELDNGHITEAMCHFLCALPNETVEKKINEIAYDYVTELMNLEDFQTAQKFMIDHPFDDCEMLLAECNDHCFLIDIAEGLKARMEESIKDISLLPDKKVREYYQNQVECETKYLDKYMSLGFSDPQMADYAYSYIGSLQSQMTGAAYYGDDNESFIVGGKLILPSLGKDFFTSVGKQFFT